MSLDLYERDTEDRLSALPGVRVPESSMWDGFARGTMNTAMLEMAKTGRAVSMAGSVGPILYDQITGGTEAQDRYFKRHDEFFDPIIDYWTPKPEEVGAAGQIAGSLLGTLPLVFANPAFAVAKTQLSMAEDLVRKGVPAEKAEQAAAVSAAGLGLGIWVPILGKTLTQRMLLGGAGFNVLQGTATRGATNVMLQGTPAAEDFQAFNPVDLTLDVLLGLAFGGFAHLTPAARAQGAEFWKAMENWRGNLTEAQVSAMTVLRQAQHAVADSLPGMPRDDFATSAHITRLNAAIESLARDQPVSIGHLPAANVAPDVNRMEASLERARGLTGDAFEANIRQQLESTGRFPTEVNESYAKLTREFYESTAKRLGITVESMIGRYGLNIVGENATGDRVLIQGPRTDWLEIQPTTFAGERQNPLAAFVEREGIRGAQGRLTRALERAEDVGGPDNARMVFEKDGKRFVVGKLTAQDWIDRVASNLDAGEIKAARAWYGDLHGLMAKFFGEKNAERYALAWLLSQQNESPSGGMRNVLRAADMARGLPEVKKAGLAQSKLIETLRGELPKEGYDAKLLDFIDSELRKSTRTVMGEDVRGGKPAVIDVWANRDVGKVDDRTLKYIADTFGEEAARHVQVDGTGIGETDYEFGSRFYNRLADELNATNVDGGNWLPLEAQAVGWTAMQKQFGASPEFPQDIFEKNIRRVSVGLAPGAGTRLSGEITPQGAARIVGAAADATGVKIQGLEVGVGAYLGDKEGAVQINVLGSPEGFQDFAAVVGHALKQTEVIISRPMLSGKTAGVTLVDLGGALADPARAEAFMAAVRAKLPEGSTIADGYQMVTIDGNPALRAFHGTWKPETGRVDWSGSWKSKELAAFNRAADEVAKEQGLHLSHHSDKFEVVSEYNDWNANPDGQAFRDSLLSRGRTALEAGLSRNDEFRILPHEIAPAPDRTQAQGVEFFQGGRAPDWYSALARGVDNLPMQAAPAEGWAGTLQALVNKGQVKADEIQWSGVLDWLKLQSGKVTKQQVTDYLKANGVQVTETMLSEGLTPTQESRLDYLDNLIRLERPLSVGERAEYDELVSRESLPRTSGFSPKYASYQLPGGKNYRELLLTLPPTKEQAQAVRAKGYSLNDVEAARLGNMFRSGHFDQPNILAHVRFNERTDADGKKVLFIEEIQSDWAQKGRKEEFDSGSYQAARAEHDRAMAATQAAYKDAVAVADNHDLSDDMFLRQVQERGIEKVNSLLTKKLTDEEIVALKRWTSAVNLEFAAETEMLRESRKVPRAPFVGKTEAWVALAMKRMTKYAADNGFDRVAWTTGEQQAARYDLSKQVDEISYFKNEDGAYELYVKTKGDNPDIERDVSAKELEGVVGKEIAKQIIEDKSGEGKIVGEGLRVGGEGMHAFYDKIVPNVANDVLKKLGGGKVDDGQIVINPKLGLRGDITAKVSGFDITPAMKERVAAGMPMFQKGLPETEAPRGKISFGPDITKRPAVISLLEGADRSTFLHESGHLYLEVYSDLMAKGRVPDEISQDFGTLMKWFGVKDAEQWKEMPLEEKRPHHEKFAKAFETYLAEGKAPRPELNSLFAQFKNWLIDVYQSLTGLGVNLTPEVRGIFDRMLGARPEVEAPRTPPPRKAGAAPATEDPLSMEADRVSRENPDLVLHMGTDADGNPVSVKVNDFLRQERAAADLAMRDADLFAIAADCLTGAV